MKTEEEVKKLLEETYGHRLQLRIDRKTKRFCRNCKHGICREFDLGDFGTMSRWECKDGRNCGEYCGFECRYSPKDIEEEMFNDIKDPAVCGAKEPKIAVLMWILHENRKPKSEDEAPSVSENEGKQEDEASSSSIPFLERLKKMFLD